MYALERSEVCEAKAGSQVVWKRMALCANRPLLEIVRGRQRQPQEWRFVKIAGENLSEAIAGRVNTLAAA